MSRYLESAHIENTLPTARYAVRCAARKTAVWILGLSLPALLAMASPALADTAAGGPNAQVQDSAGTGQPAGTFVEGADTAARAVQPPDMNRVRQSLRWEDLDALIETKSPVFAGMRNSNLKEAEASIEGSRLAMDEERAKLSGQIDEMDAQLRQLRQSDNPLMQQQAALLEAGLAQARAGRDSLGASQRRLSAMKRATAAKIENGFKAQKPLILQGAEQLYLGISRLQAAVEIQQAQLTLQQATETATAGALAQGLRTQAQLQQENLESAKAEARLETQKNQLRQLKGKLALLLGIDIPDSGLDAWKLEPLPLPGEAELTVFDTAADETRALQSSRELGAVARIVARKSGERTAKQASYEETAASVKIALSKQQARLRAQQLRMKSARTGEQAAALGLAAAERKQALGLVGRAELEGLRLQSIAAGAQAQLAQMDVFADYLSYQWLLKGFLPSDEN